jgi:hypothetical protein
MRLQKQLPSLSYRQVVRRFRRERKWRSWWVDIWEGHRRSKVNRVLPWAQRRQHNPESIDSRTTSQRARRAIINQLAYSKRISFHGCKGEGWGWGYCPVIRQTLQCLRVDISLQLCPQLSGVIGLGCGAGPQCGIVRPVRLGGDETCLSWRLISLYICFCNRPLNVEDREQNSLPDRYGTVARSRRNQEPYLTRFIGTVIKRRLQERPLPPSCTLLAVRLSIRTGVYWENARVCITRKCHRRP